MNTSIAVMLVLLVAILLICIATKSSRRHTEPFSSGGFLTTSGLAFNNRLNYSLPPSGAFSGGTFIPGYVTF